MHAKVKLSQSGNIHTIPYHTIPYHTIPYHTIPYHTIPYHTIPYHTIPYHTIPYHTIWPLLSLARQIPMWKGLMILHKPTCAICNYCVIVVNFCTISFVVR